MSATEQAPAKVNLFLHVGPPDGDGYHPLASLVAFADVGDAVTLALAQTSAFEVTGPFAGALADEPDNLVARALGAYARAVGDPALAFHARLDKRLPIAAGLGGGSSDAGAALRLAERLTGGRLGSAGLEAVAAGLGADGPMCLHARSAWAEGRGERLSFEPAFAPLPAVLCNPGVASPTGAVYRAYDAAVTGGADRPHAPSDWSVARVIDWLGEQRNDLEAPAIALAPAIGEALAAVRVLPGARLARMSGSGATVFALFETRSEAEVAARSLALSRPGWWVRATTLG